MLRPGRRRRESAHDCRSRLHPAIVTEVNEGLDMPQLIDILDGGTIYYEESFFPKDKADALFERLLSETPWTQESGRFGPFPRLTAWYADAGLSYSYSGVTHHAIPWTPTLEEIRHSVEKVAGAEFNS